MEKMGCKDRDEVLSKMLCIAQAESEQEYEERVNALKQSVAWKNKDFQKWFQNFGLAERKVCPICVDFMEEGMPESQERNLTTSNPCFPVYFLSFPLGKEGGEGIKAYNYPIITLPFTWLTFLLLICCKRWVWAYRKDCIIGISTTNGVERQNRALKHHYLASHRDKTLIGLLSVLSTDFLPDNYSRYCIC